MVFWKGLVRSLAIKKTLCQAWGCSVSEANSFFGSDKVATTGNKRKSKHLPGVKTQAGNKKPGQASNPGPSLFFSNFERSKFFFGTSDGAWARKTRVFPLVLSLECPLVRGLFGFRSLDRTIFRLNFGIRNFLLLKLIRDGVEPNPGPLRLQQQHSSFRVCSLNVQGVPGAYRALNLLPQQGYQILGLQETKFSANEWRSFALAAGRAGFKGYHLAGPTREDGLPGGGVVLLVSNNLAHKFADSLSVGRSQVLMVWSQGLGVMTYYGPPGAEEDLEEAMLQCHVRCQLHNHEWIFFGDSNQAPQGSSLETFLRNSGAFSVSDREPTRWASDNCIDWFAATPGAGLCWGGRDLIKVSDHIPVWASVARTRSALDTTKGRLRPGPVWEKPSSISVQEWRKLLIATWDSCVAGSFSRLLTILASQNINVHEEWDMFLDCLDLLFRNSFQCLADGHAEQVVRDEALDTLCKPFHNQPKPPLPVFQFVNLDKSSGGSQDDGVSHRKRAKRLARLHEARRLLLANNRSSTHDRQLGVLFHKLWGHRPQGFQTALCTIRREILDLQQEQCCREEARKKARLDKWRQDMREGNLRKLVRWIKGKETEQKAVSIRKGNLVGETRKETLSLIREHWCSVWQDRPRSAEAIAETLLQGFPQELQGPRVWQPLTKDQLACAVLNCSGSAGPDAWSAAEVKHLPPQAIDLFFRLTERWISSQTLPRALRFAKQRVNLPKDSKVLSDHTLNVESTRPISVLSIWWRIFASAVAKSPALRDWCQEALHDDVTCLAGTAGAEETAATIHEAWVQQGSGFLASLDWSQAYDRMDATATSAVLSRLGWPEGLTKLMLQAWQHKRFLVWDGEVDSRILESEHALPQGCPLSPVALASWTSSGLRVTNSQLLEDGHQLGKQAVYMDDRTFIGEHWIDTSARIQAWKSWSVSVNLRENDNKTQITSRGKDADISQCPESRRKPEVKILGVYSVSKGARACVPEEEARLDKARRRADLL